MSADAWYHHVLSINPMPRALFESETVDEFLDAAEHLLGLVVGKMESSRATYRKLAEPDLSNLVVQLLGDLVPASAEAHTNGHVDVTIRHPRNLGYKHITECKIWNGERWHREGMHQLVHYATGTERRTMCLAFFVRHKRMAFLLARLRTGMGASSDPPVTGPVEDHPFLSAAFVSVHEHGSGRPLRIVHYGCHLWDDTVEDAGDKEEG
jgi:hypothetical protein